ncbi:hypothetical protein [Bradyrhizobium sp. SEMIA]|uniref:hypothetical protein n=1 Tax=Bradyrhizobium sp. SEMIA TaxID=2597515 RepID=UPI0018A4DA27|nr:hypothetical protein [Bradyrhizobium sp. SEMIA]QOG22053.1 hypothetical protein FOM02_36955 [Bradyrhizobium sp. SEMIA]
MWMTLISFLGGPVVKALIDAYSAKLKVENVDTKIAADLAASEIASQTAETKAVMQYRTAELGYWYEPDKLIGYCVTIYFAKLLVWDKVLGLGTTDALAGFAAITANLVVSFYFAKRGFENVARIIKR